MDNSNNIKNINNITTSKLIINNNYINTKSSIPININGINNKTKYKNADINRSLSKWTLRSTSNNSYYSNCWSPELGIFVGISVDGTNKVATSTNGIVWIDVISAVASAGSWYSICWSSELSLFVAVGTGTSSIMTSTDGIVWMKEICLDANPWKSICWSPELNLFVSVCISGTYRVMISNNGIDWFRSIASSAFAWDNICWANTLGLFVATSTDNVTNNIMTSPDGIKWTTQILPIASSIKNLSWSQELGMLIAVCGGKNYFYSKDGINWYTNLFNLSLSWNTVSWISDIEIFIAITLSTIGLTYSYNGLDWITVPISGNSNYYTSIIWSSELNMLVASSQSGTASFKMFTSDIFSPNNKSCIMSNSLDFSINNTNGMVGIGAIPSIFQLQLSTDSASKPSSSSWTVSSDSRLKINIQNADLNLCYNNIKNLRLAKYTWKDVVYTNEEVPDRSKLGWIAQEVETIFPKSVDKINAHGFTDCRTLNIDQIIASLYGLSQKIIENYDNDNGILTSLENKLTVIESFINNIPEE
jgi:hypothetical protein